MRFHLRRVRDAFGRAGAWCALFVRRLRHALTRRFVLVPMLAILSLWFYSHYVTQLNFFIIFDQDRVTVHGTYTRDPELVLAEAGIFIGGTDFVSLPQGLLIGGAAEIQIVRSSEITVNVSIEGVPSRIALPGGTVADALEMAGYASHPSENVRDVISPNLGSPLEDGMEITVTRYTVLTEVKIEDIPFGIVEQTSPNVNAGTSVVTVEGELGALELTYEVVLRDGEEIHRTEPREALLKEPVTQIVVNGTGGTVRLADGTYRRYVRRLEIIATAYTTERQTGKINAIGNIARVGTIAVDPKVIPLRIDVFVTSRNGSWFYGLARTEDTGGKIKGNIIDLFFDTWDECIRFGRRTGYLYILE
ncbi:MAG: 3D domain-containing protein [Oscillospiraceae bacterium]|nr:3D domain-containing protein [Oscillospiraceae bacterium]